MDFMELEIVGLQFMLRNKVDLIRFTFCPDQLEYESKQYKIDEASDASTL